MDLNEMKASWQLLSDRLQKQEIVNKRMIREMITRRTVSAHTRLVVSNGAGFCLLIAIMVALLIGRNSIQIRPEVFWIGIGALWVVIVYTLVSARFLSRFNLEKGTLVELRNWVLQLRKRQRMELWGGPIYGSIFFLIVFFLHHHYRSVYQLLVDVGAIVFAAVAVYYSYRYIDKKSADEIARGVKELEELEQDEMPAKEVRGKAEGERD